ncbi:unnamed protein product [Paramecium sonneborni]|uniref:Uncharacterized protein n=1 Tax=Paramecium sonneborni TaxID=65129 RepID=A0A8S1KHR2_9CILI|nr:unnamed protein product [Paramecium sonneborni]
MNQSQQGQIFSKQPQEGHQQVQDSQNQKKVKIDSQKSYSDLNEPIYQNMIKSFTDFFEQLRKQIKILMEDPCLKQHKIFEIITQLNQSITKTESLFKQDQEKLYATQKIYNDNSIQNQLKQTKQCLGDVDEPHSMVPKQEYQNYKKNEKEVNNNQIHQRCIINHKYIQDNLQEYQLIVQASLELQLKGGPKLLKCLCKKNKDLSISNRNLFEIIENQQMEILFKQLEKIFQDIPNKNVLKCPNNLCNYKCAENVLKDQKKQKYYCPSCNENSIECS